MLQLEGINQWDRNCNNPRKKTYHVLDSDQRAVGKEQEVKKTMCNDDILCAINHGRKGSKTRRQ